MSQSAETIKNQSDLNLSKTIDIPRIEQLTKETLTAFIDSLYYRLEEFGNSRLESFEYVSCLVKPSYGFSVNETIKTLTNKNFKYSNEWNNGNIISCFSTSKKGSNEGYRSTLYLSRSLHDGGIVAVPILTVKAWKKSDCNLVAELINDHVCW